MKIYPQSIVFHDGDRPKNNNDMIQALDHRDKSSFPSTKLHGDRAYKRRLCFNKINIGYSENKPDSQCWVGLNEYHGINKFILGTT